MEPTKLQPNHMTKLKWNHKKSKLNHSKRKLKSNLIKLELKPCESKKLESNHNRTTTLHCPTKSKPRTSK